MLKDYDEIKEEIKNMIKFIGDFSLFMKECCHIVWSVEKIQKVKSKICKRKKRKNNAFIKMCSVW